MKFRIRKVEAWFGAEIPGRKARRPSVVEREDLEG